MSLSASVNPALKPEIALHLATCDPQDRGLAITWSDGVESFFHYVWLRDCCYCDICGDAYSSQRRFIPCDAPLDIRPSKAAIEDDGVLVIEWSPDDHRSRYDGAWLRRYRYDEAARRARRRAPVLWNAALRREAVSFAFDRVSGHDQDRWSLYRALRDYGVAIVRGGPKRPGSVAAFAGLLGELQSSAYGEIFDISPDNAIGTLATTLRAVPPHTDEPFRYSPPGIMALACVRQAETGGDTVLADGFHLAARLRALDPAGFRILCERSQTYIRSHPGRMDQRALAPMIALDDDGAVCGIRLHSRSAGPLDLPADVMEAFYGAYHRLTQLMTAPENQVELTLEAGDAVLFDNHRVLHARSAFSDRRRFLQICSVPREQFHERYRLLACRMACDEEADLALPAGAVR